MSEQPKCQLCGEAMPEGEEMFFYHGHSGPCPKPPIPAKPTVEDCINACLAAVYAAKMAREYEDSDGIKQRDIIERLKAEAYEAMSKAIAALPEETT